MLIRAMYKNGRYDMLKPIMLDRLIISGRIKKFLRRDGWVEIGINKIRGMGGNNYDGPDRRVTL